MFIFVAALFTVAKTWKQPVFFFFFLDKAYIAIGFFLYPHLIFYLSHKTCFFISVCHFSFNHKLP